MGDDDGDNFNWQLSGRHLERWRSKIRAIQLDGQINRVERYNEIENMSRLTESRDRRRRGAQMVGGGCEIRRF